MWMLADIGTIMNLQILINKIWEEEKIPVDWKNALIHPIHKKGDKTDTNNLRGISLLPTAYKIFARALQNRLEIQLEHQIGEYQGGFRKGRSCAEQIMNLKCVIRYRKMRNKDLYITFVDFKKAYDSIDRTSLLNVLIEFVTDDKSISILKDMLTDTKSSVKFMGEISKPFVVETGVRQGDGLSPMLFNCLLEKVIREWRKRTEKEGIKKIRIGRKKDDIEVDCLAFADDLAIFAESLEDATKQINILKEMAEKTGLQISYEKTTYMTNRKDSPKHMITKYGKINRVEKFKYLGEIIQPNALDKEAIMARKRKMETAFHLTKGRYNKKCLSINAKLRHYQTVIKPEGLYASECLVMNTNNQMEELEKERR